MSQGIPPPPPPPSPSAYGSAARPRVRWGIGDFFLAFGVGLLVSVVAAAFVINASDPVQLIVLVAAQNAGIVLYLELIARGKGLGSFRADFGFTLRPSTGSWLENLTWFLAGVGIQLVALLPINLLSELHGTVEKQDVVKMAERGRGVQIALIVLVIAVLGPITEELLFRGALLRALLRKTDPDRAVFIGATVFGLVHVVGSPDLGSLMALPAIIGLGVVSGYQAVKTGTLTRSIMLHMGFNALTTLFLFA